MLKGKVCFITGCSRGIGKKIVETFAIEEAIVYANAREKGCIDEYCRELASRYHTAVNPLYFDLCERESVKEGLAQIKREQGKLDVLVNNAGVASNMLFEMITGEELSRVFSTNVFAVINMMQGAIRMMKRQGAGKIINISSCVGMDGNAGQGAYAASKGAVNAITKSAAKEMAKYGICINAVAPGIVNTEMYEAVDKSKIREREKRIMLGRLAEPEDVANCCAFLASSKADFITGQIIKVDGCMLM